MAERLEEHRFDLGSFGLVYAPEDILEHPVIAVSR